MQILSTVELTKSYKGRKVVDDISLRITQGEVVGLLGPNGAGKTTTFYIIVGLTSPDSGRVLLDGVNITDFPMYVRARNGISYLPQEPSIFRKLTVEENIMAVLETLPLTPHQRRERLEELIEDLGLQQVQAKRRVHAVGRGAEACGDREVSGDFALLHSSGRTVLGHRPAHGSGYTENHCAPERRPGLGFW